MNRKNLPFLYIAFGLLSFNIWTAWKQPESTKIETSTPVLSSRPNLETTSSSPENGIIATISTDVYQLKLDQQGNIVFASLSKFPNKTGPDASPLVLLKQNLQEQYYVNSEFVQMVNNKPEAEKISYQASQKSYVMQADQNELKVVLQGRSQDGITVEKIYQFKRDSYVIDLSYQLQNDSNSIWKAYLNQQLIWQNPKVPEFSLLQAGQYRSFMGASYSQPGEHRYKKVSFDDMKKKNLDVDAHGGWVAMQQHYFLSAWVPNQNVLHRLYTQANQDKFIIGAVSEPYTLNPSQQLNFNSRLYLGPEQAKVLKSLAPGLDQTIDYGILWFLSDFLFSFMKSIEQFIGNWGWSIVIITVLIKLMFYRLSAQSYKSMANMRRLQPKLEQLKQRFGHDRAKFSQATMELYRQEKVNPLGGCLPMLVQVPVFIALYSVLVESVDLRQAPFIFWIHDLSSADPYHVLPLLMGLSLFVQQKMNPSPPDPAQAKAMMLLPLFMTVLFWGFPSGLVLYWIVNTSLSILQQWWIMRKFANMPLVTSA
jgi:YidC/Oxa1 family membrane protein insertase